MAVERIYISAYETGGDGWETGAITDIDESVLSADGNFISTTTNFQTVVFSMTDVASIVDNDTVTDVRIVARVTDDDPTTPPDSSYISVDLRIGGTSQGLTTVAVPGNDTFSNVEVTNAGWSQDWTASQLNSAVVTLTAYVYSGGEIKLDCLDIVVTYTPVGSVVSEPGVGTLTLTEATPTAIYTQLVAPAAGALSLASDAPTLLVPQTIEPPEALLRFSTATSPLDLGVLLPAATALTVTGQSVAASRNETVAPGAETLSFSGQAVTIDLEEDVYTSPPAGELSFWTEAPSSVDPGETYVNPGVLRATFNVQLPTLDLTENSLRLPPSGSLLLTGSPPSLVAGTVKTPAAATLSLAGQVFIASRSDTVQPLVGALSLAGQTPIVGDTAAALVLTGQAPTALVSMQRLVGAGALTLTGHVPLSLNAAEYTPEGELTLTGHVPVLDLSTTFSSGSRTRLSRLTVDYTFEFLGNPYEEL